jgi:hypothetical protein
MSQNGILTKSFQKLNPVIFSGIFQFDLLLVLCPPISWETIF